MSIFREMYELHRIESLFHYRELLRMLWEAIERGWVEEIPASVKALVQRDERWFREKETGEVYRLSPPDERSYGHWSEVELKELFPDAVHAPMGQSIQ